MLDNDQINNNGSDGVHIIGGADPLNTLLDSDDIDNNAGNGLSANAGLVSVSNSSLSGRPTPVDFNGDRASYPWLTTLSRRTPRAWQLQTAARSCSTARPTRCSGTRPTAARPRPCQTERSARPDLPPRGRQRHERGNMSTRDREKPAHRAKPGKVELVTCKVVKVKVKGKKVKRNKCTAKGWSRHGQVHDLEHESAPRIACQRRSCLRDRHRHEEGAEASRWSSRTFWALHAHAPLPAAITGWWPRAFGSRSVDWKGGRALGLGRP